MRIIVLTLACKGLIDNDGCHVRFATLMDKNVVSMGNKKYTCMNYLEKCQASNRSKTWMCRTRTDGPNEVEPLKFDCI